MENSTLSAINRKFHMKKASREELIKSRREEIYIKLPRIREIDDEIWSGGFKMLSEVWANGLNPERTAEAYAQRVTSLAEEKRSILAKSGYNPDYLEPPYECDRCHDSGLSDGKLCSCYLNSVVDALYEESNMGTLLREQTFDKFNVNYYGTTVPEGKAMSPRKNILSILEICKDFVNGFDSKEENLLFYGSPGLGKTFLSSSVANALLKKGKTVLYQSAGQVFTLLDDIRFGRNTDNTAQYIASRLLTSDLLIIDDLGTEFITTMTEAEFFRIVNTRILNKKSTIISTNLKLNEISRQYSDRILSRLLGHYNHLHFYGEDIRSMMR